MILYFEVTRTNARCGYSPFNKIVLKHTLTKERIIFMETILFFIIMIVGHGLMMFMMPGMHVGHGKKHNHGENSSDDVKLLKTENEELKEELHAVKSRLNR